MRQYQPKVRSFVLAAVAAAISVVGVVATALAGSGGGPFPK
jgi:hypothetical protein